MIAFIDTNIILDIVTKREPHFKVSLQAVKALLKAKYELFISANCITDIFYIAKRIGIEGKEIKDRIEDLLSFMDVLTTTKSDILKALKMDITDLEDGLQFQCARKGKAEFILTRDKDFPSSIIKAITPSEYIKNV